MARCFVALPCYAGGRTVLTWNMCAQRTGSNNDRSQWRIVRRRSGYADYYLPGTPDVTLTNNRDIRSWTWVDDNIPADGPYEYALQIMRLEGIGTVYEMILNAQHFKR